MSDTTDRHPRANYLGIPGCAEDRPQASPTAATRIESELLALEPIFHSPRSGRTRDDYVAQTAEDFVKVGASGRVYQRQHVLDRLEERSDLPDEEYWVVSDARCRPVAENTYVFTYRLEQGGRPTRRLTLWQREPAGWKALYHQGTLIQDDCKHGGFI